MRAPAVLLLGHHGTAGADRARALAFAIAQPGRTTVLHAVVVPEFWGGMQGDDWLNNASTRDAFARHLETQLERETAEQLRTLEALCAERGLAYRAAVRFGDPADCLVRLAHEDSAELVVIGPPRPRGTPGYRSRVDLEILVRKLPCPLLVASGQ